MKISPYTPIGFIDHILRIDENGNFIPIIDESTGKQKVNPITGALEWEVFKKGTRHKASVMNHMEAGILAAHLGLFEMDKSLKKILAQLSASDRVPGNNGTFADAFDGTVGRLIRLTAMTDVTAAVTIGSTVIPVASTEGFEVMTYVTIFDADSYEHVLISAVGEGSITVQTLTSDYAKGAKIARSTASINTKNQTMDVAPFVTYQVELLEVL